MENQLSAEDRKVLLSLARETIIMAVDHLSLPKIQSEKLSPRLRQIGASFVTLTIHGQLRGCIGTLEAYQSLVEDVQEHAVQAALEDHRFPPVIPAEIPRIKIEISRLTEPEVLEYASPTGLADLLRPSIDGVILKDGFRRATFLPQVWDQIPDPREFLSHLCAKMGVSSDLWKRKMLEVSIYQVEEFEED
ncbi:MAG: AmmeMemoRadiSam system protein A [Chloroflexi bacterium]|nr:AmmeMemoRadiSam system protein A [Chloroflexota bacterium]